MGVEHAYATLEEVSGLPDVLDKLRPQLRHEPRHAQRVPLQRDPTAHPPESELSVGVESRGDDLDDLPLCKLRHALLLRCALHSFAVAADPARDAGLPS